MQGTVVSDMIGEVDFEALRAAGIRFVYVRATEGTVLMDAGFEATLKKARSAGLKVGALHMVRPGQNTQAQWLRFVQSTIGLQPDLPPLLMLGRDDGKGTPHVQRVIERLFQLAKNSALPLPVLGASVAMFSKHLYGLGQHLPIWIQDYRSGDQPTLPPPYIAWAFWHYAELAQLPGIAGYADRIAFAGSEADFKLLCRPDENPKPVAN